MVASIHDLLLDAETAVHVVDKVPSTTSSSSSSSTTSSNNDGSAKTANMKNYTNYKNYKAVSSKKYVEFLAVIHKPSSTDKLGFNFNKKTPNGEMIISKIVPTGLVAQQTRLQVGDILLAINNVGCSAFSSNGITYQGLSPAEAKQLLSSTKVVEIRAMKPSSLRESTIVQTGPYPHNNIIMEAVIHRASTQEPLGFNIRRLDNGGGLIVKRTLPGGLVTRQETGLRAGYQILAINGNDASTMTCETALDIIKADATVTIRAKKRVFPPDTILRAIVVKEAPDTKLGMTLRENKDGQGQVYIKDIIHDSLVYHTGLQVGSLLLSVGNMDCQGKHLTAVQQIIASLPAGSITIRTKVPSCSF